MIREETFKRRARTPAAPQCPYCHTNARLDNGAAIGRSAPVWLCGNHPDCDSYVGCHPGTTRPLGSLANAQLRQKRIAVHRCIDRLWRNSSGHLPRKQVYSLVAAVMNRPTFHAGLARDDDIRAFEQAWPRIEATASEWLQQAIRLAPSAPAPPGPAAQTYRLKLVATIV